MNIKEIIDSERWHDHDGAIVPMISGFDLNRRLDRIEAAVMKHIAELEADKKWLHNFLQQR